MNQNSSVESRFLLTYNVFGKNLTWDLKKKIENENYTEIVDISHLCETDWLFFIVPEKDHLFLMLIPAIKEFGSHSQK